MIMQQNYRFLLPLMMMMIIILQSTLVSTLDSSDEQQKQSNSETTATTSISTIDTDIERVKLSLNEIELLLNQAKQTDKGNGDGGKQQFAELHRHIHIIKDQLNLIQEEYEMNKNLDHFLEQIQQWHIDAQTLGLRLKRDLQSFHH
ncbi:uncharacterized protein LOC113788831 [Dermatophagoides pteronyssinus]|uniref:uncharacterized protein LOC113788831 n=1 Tax=Dermatophagoides pteronyssinus TaxID=6956 RepID=UPI003F676C1C